MTIEYKVTHEDPYLDKDELEELLNKYGEDDWQLVMAELSAGDVFKPPVMALVFSRAKKEI